MSNSTIAKLVAWAIAAVVVVGLVVHLVGSHGAVKSTGATNPSGGNVYQQVDTYVNGLTIGSKFQNWQPFVMPIGTNQVAWCNTTGQIVYAGGARFTLASTTANGSVSASSTLALSVGTSTKSTVTDGAAVWGGLIDQVLIATSTNSIDTKSQVILGGQATTGVGGLATSTIPISTSECLVASLENPYSQNCGASGACETATSSKRGYILNGIVELSF